MYQAKLNYSQEINACAKMCTRFFDSTENNKKSSESLSKNPKWIGRISTSFINFSSNFFSSFFHHLYIKTNHNELNLILAIVLSSSFYFHIQSLYDLDRVFILIWECMYVFVCFYGLLYEIYHLFINMRKAFGSVGLQKRSFLTHNKIAFEFVETFHGDNN